MLLLNRLPPGWKDRGEGIDAWVERYGESELPEVESYLRLVCFSFLLRASDRRYLLPGDWPHEIYEANYGGRPDKADTLEWEHFVAELESEYALRIDRDLEALSLAEIFDLVRGGEAASSHP